MELARVCSAVDLVEPSVDAMLTEHGLDGVAVDEPGIEFKDELYGLKTFAFGGYCNGRRYWRCAAVKGLGAQYMYYIPSDGAWKISDVLGDPACAYRLPDEAGTSPLDAAGAKWLRPSGAELDPQATLTPTAGRKITLRDALVSFLKRRLEDAELRPLLAYGELDLAHTKVGPVKSLGRGMRRAPAPHPCPAHHLANAATLHACAHLSRRRSPRQGEW
jgi:hypothetical protein